MDACRRQAGLRTALRPRAPFSVLFFTFHVFVFSSPGIEFVQRAGSRHRLPGLDSPMGGTP